MVTPILVAPDIEATARFFKHLEDAGVPLSAALWTWEAESDEWRLQLVSPLVESKGRSKVHKEIIKVMNMPDSGLPPNFMDLSAHSPKEQYGKDLRKLYKRAKNVVIHRGSFGGRHFDKAYIYFVK